MVRNANLRRRFFVPVIAALMTTVLSPLPQAFAEIPTITEFSPATGGEGTRVVIIGKGFDERSAGTGNCLATAVQFGDTDAARFVVNSDKQITATVGRGGSGVITVTTEGDRCGRVRSEREFVWTDKIAPVAYDGNGATSGTVPVDGTTPYAIGDFVTVLGNIGSLARSGYVFSDWNTAIDGSGTRLRPGDTFRIETDTVLYAQWSLAAPTITSFAPTSGVSGTSVVITGTNFSGATAVRFGGANAASYVVNSSMRITAIVGTGATGTVTVVTAGGTATSLATFTFISSDATLSALAISAGTLAPAFASGTLTYTASVGYATASMTVSPTVHESHATIQVRINGGSYAPVTSGSPSGSLSLNVGSNTVNVLVTAQDGTTTATYTVTVTRSPASTNAYLSELALSAGTLAPSFDYETYSYVASVENTTSSMTVTPTVEESHATIQVRINGGSYVAVTSGSLSGSLSLNVGSNTVNVLVTAQDGVTTATYTVTVTRSAASTNADLVTLALSAGSLAPAFDPYVYTYTASVLNTTSSMTLTPTVEESHATITVNGSTVTSGSPSAPLALTVGSNTITVIVTAQDGTHTRTYAVTVTRSAPDGAPSALSGLTISAGTLAPLFASGTLTYTASVDNGVTSLTITPTVAESHATVTANGSTVTSGSPSAPFALVVGSNTITVVVTAQDGITTTYTVTVTRSSASTASDLSSLAISHGTIAPTFASHVLGYTASVDNGTASMTVTPTVAESHASVTVNGTTVASGTASGAIALSVGSNTITIVVTAQNGVDTHTYTVTVTRSTPSSGAFLSGLALSQGILAPSFAEERTSYTASVDYGTTSITVTPSAEEPRSTISVNRVAVPSGAPSNAIALSVGSNSITIIVTARDGVTSTTYNVIVTRSAGIPIIPITPPIITPPTTTIDNPLEQIVRFNEPGDTVIDATIHGIGGTPFVVSVTVPAGAILRDITISITPAVTPAETTSGFIVIGVSATDSSGTSITQFGRPLIIDLGHMNAGASVVFSQDGIAWMPIQLLSGTTLPNGMNEGYYVALDGHTIILTHHLTYFGVKTNQVRLRILSSAYILKVGESVTLNAIGGSTGGDIRFVTTTPSVCSVSETGSVTALTAGVCTVEATKSGGATYLDVFSLPFNLTIQKSVQVPLALNSSTHTLSVGGSSTLTTSGGSGQGAIKFLTTTPKYCSVSDAGLVRAIVSGICKVEATKAGDDTYFGIASWPVFLTIKRVLLVPPSIPDKTVNGGLLPKTSSPWYNLLALGIGLTFLGAAGWARRRRSITRSQMAIKL